VNRAIQDWNQLPAEVLGTFPCKPNTLKKIVRKVINEVSLKKIKFVENHLKVLGSEVKCKSSRSVVK
jgi:hypothetical protein